MGQGFKIHDGPFVKTLDSTLASFNVERQAYYSGTFVGNHVHRTLQVQYILIHIINISYTKLHSLKIQNGCVTP